MRSLTIAVQVTLTAAFLVAAAVPASADWPGAGGKWTVTFYSEPGRIASATQCIVFTHVSGTVNGEASSGTWTSPTFPGWGGIYWQEADHLNWNGTTSSLASAVHGNLISPGLIGGQSFETFSLSTPSTNSNAGSWAATKGCAAGMRVRHFGDPTR